MSAEELQPISDLVVCSSGADRWPSVSARWLSGAGACDSRSHVRPRGPRSTRSSRRSTYSTGTRAVTRTSRPGATTSRRVDLGSLIPSLIHPRTPAFIAVYRRPLGRHVDHHGWSCTMIRNPESEGRRFGLGHLNRPEPSFSGHWLPVNKRTSVGGRHPHQLRQHVDTGCGPFACEPPDFLEAVNGSVNETARDRAERRRHRGPGTSSARPSAQASAP